VTLFYGIQEDAVDKIRELLKGIKPFEARMGLVTAFKDKDTNDVLKIDIECPELIKIHYMIRDKIKNDNKFPTYHPHITVAYMKKNKANRLIGDDHFRGRVFKVTEIMYSSKGHEKIQITLGS
jgi:2'-5' RNA ligase